MNLSYQKTEKRVMELEKQYVAMRDTLKEIINAPIVFTDDRLDYVEIQVSKASLKDAEKILSSNTGCELFERIKQLEAVTEAARYLTQTEEGTDAFYDALEKIYDSLFALDEI